MAKDLIGQCILITGGSSGIGAATARACAEAGMDVVVAARRENKLRDVVADIEKVSRPGGRALAVTCDVDSEADVARLVEQTLSTFGRLDVAFANAGYGIVGPVHETTDEQTHALFETNFHGTLRLIRHVIPHMRQARRGHIVICSSAASELGVPLYGVYAATKAAQDSLAGAMRAELADEHINVTSVHPIGTRSEFFDDIETTASNEVALNTPEWMMQTSDHVARCIVKALRRPRPEVWPNPWIRLAMALFTASPRLGAWAMRRHYRQGGMREK